MAPTTSEPSPAPRRQGAFQELGEQGLVLGEHAVLRVVGEVGRDVAAALHHLLAQQMPAAEEVVDGGDAAHQQGHARDQEDELASGSTSLASAIAVPVRSTLLAALSASAGISIFSLSAIFLLITSSARGHEDGPLRGLVPGRDAVHQVARPARPPMPRSGPLLTSAPSAHQGGGEAVDRLAGLQGLGQDEAARLVAQQDRVGGDPERVHRVVPLEQRRAGPRGRPSRTRPDAPPRSAAPPAPPSAPPATSLPLSGRCR